MSESRYLCLPPADMRAPRPTEPSCSLAAIWGPGTFGRNVLVIRCVEQKLRLGGRSENQLSILSEELLLLIRPQSLMLRRTGIQQNNPSSCL